MINIELIKKMSQCICPSGEEGQIREIIIEQIKDFVTDYRVDVLGNLIAYKKGTDSSKKIMISSHMDEIGFMVTFIEDNGFVRFSSIGGINANNVYHSKVIFQNGAIGVIGAETKDGYKAELKKMYIDIGANNKAEAEKIVSIGDVCGFYSTFAVMNDKICGKSMDDRIACYIAVEAIKNIKTPKDDMYFVFSVQEEVGLRGARTAAYGVDPDYGIALDVTATGDTPNVREMAVACGGGAAVKIKDSSILSHHIIRETLIDCANRNGIKYQLEVLESGGTDAGAIHISRSGVPSGGISIPCRYIHSSGETVSINDVEACIALLTAVGDTDFPKIG